MVPLLRRRRKFPIRVEDIMSSPPITAGPMTPVEEVAKIMYENKIGSVLIVGSDGKLEGIVTERDILFAAANDKVGKGLPAYMIMSENPITATPGTPLMQAIRKMREANIRHLPVVDEEGKPVGIISLRDVIDAVLMLLDIFA